MVLFEIVKSTLSGIEKYAKNFKNILILAVITIKKM